MNQLIPLGETTQLNLFVEVASPQTPNPYKTFKKHDNRTMAYLFTIGPKKAYRHFLIKNNNDDD